MTAAGLVLVAAVLVREVAGRWCARGRVVLLTARSPRVPGMRAVPRAGDARRAVGGEAVGLRLTLATVVAAVRSGRAPHEAWRQVGVTCTARGVPRVRDLEGLAQTDLRGSGGRAPSRLTAVLRLLRPLGLLRRARRRSVPAAARGLAVQQALAITGACTVAVELGAPLADVLEAVGASLAEHQEAVDDRRAALAGPRASAAVLTSLPLVTLLGAAALGARPWQTATDGSLGTLAAGLGLLLLWVGRRWTAGLVARAERAGGEPSGLVSR